MSRSELPSVGIGTSVGVDVVAGVSVKIGVGEKVEVSEGKPVDITDGEDVAVGITVTLLDVGIRATGVSVSRTPEAFLEQIHALISSKTPQPMIVSLFRLRRSILILSMFNSSIC